MSTSERSEETSSAGSPAHRLGGEPPPATIDDRDAAYAEARRRLSSPNAEATANGLTLLRTLAEAGHARAQFHLGLLLAHGGAGLSADPAEATRWCEAAANASLGKAQFNLGLLYAGGIGTGQDAMTALRWLRLAAANGIEEAERCLDLVHGSASSRPTTWEEAATRTSVALARTDEGGGKALRFAEYYVDPCINLLTEQLRLSREESEEIVQDFMLELELPLSKGEHRGHTWKESLRKRFVAGERRSFRGYLYRVLVNFTRDRMRRERRRELAQPITDLDAATVRDQHQDEWTAMLTAFTDAVSDIPSGRQAAAVLRRLLADGDSITAIAQQEGIDGRTARRRLQLASELLITWLDRRIPLPPADGKRLREGLRLLPGWLHYPSEDKRTRALLFLALVHRCTPAQGR